MGTRFPLQDGEAVLAEADCRSHRGPLAISGVATLTDRRLHFFPGLLDRAAGASAWQASINAIERTEVKGLDKILEITAGETVRRISGKGTGPLVSRLQDLLSERGGEASAETLFEPGERILLQGDAELLVSKRVSTTGELVVTDRRVRFTPARRLETFIYKAELIEVRLSKIRRAKMAGVRRLELVVGDDTHLFAGPLMPRMYGVLVVLCDKANSGGLVNMWSTTLAKGPLTQKGELVLGFNRLVFTPSGALDGAVGLDEPVNLPLSRLTRVELKGLLEKQIRICAGSKDYVFGLADPAERVLDFLPLLMQVSGKKEPTQFGFGAAIPQKAISKYLSGWEEVGVIRAKDVHALEPVVRFDEEGPAVLRGWICLTSWHVVFLPVGGTKGIERPAVLPIADVELVVEKEAEQTSDPLDTFFEIEERDLREAESEDLKLSAHGETMHVFPRTGERFVARFKEMLSELQAHALRAAGKPAEIAPTGAQPPVQVEAPATTPAPAPAKPDKMHPAIVSSGLHERIDRIQREEQRIVGRADKLAEALHASEGDNVQMAQLQAQVAAVQAELASLKARRAQEEARLMALRAKISAEDLRLAEGRSGALASQEMASEQDEGLGELFERSADTQNDQRTDVRVRIKPAATVQLQRSGDNARTPEQVDCRIRDLSVGGTCIMAREVLRLGDRFVTQLPMHPDPGPLLAEIVYVKAMWKGFWRYGLEFRDVSIAAASDLNAIVVHVQREAIRHLTRTSR